MHIMGEPCSPCRGDQAFAAENRETCQDKQGAVLGRSTECIEECQICIQYTWANLQGKYMIGASVQKN